MHHHIRPEGYGVPEAFEIPKDFVFKIVRPKGNDCQHKFSDRIYDHIHSGKLL